MSIIMCERCNHRIDSDYDAECFVEIGNMRRLHQTIVLCEACRDKMAEEEEYQASLDKS